MNFKDKISVLLDGSLCDYKISYTLTHPQIIFTYLYREAKWAWQRVYRGWDDRVIEAKWAWQRVYRGWDDRVIWSIDWYLSKNMPVWLAKLKEDKVGVPSICFDKEDVNCTDIETARKRWDGLLDKMIEGFVIAQHIGEIQWKDNEEYEQYRDKFKACMSVFVEYYFSLWD